MKKLTAGSRGSKLAMVQTEWVINELGCEADIKKITTRGDKIHDVALARIEGKGFFTKEIDEALLQNEIDFAVHSFKDLPTDIPGGIIVAAVPARESSCDALVGKYPVLDELPMHAKVGTASLRRKAQVLKHRPDVEVLDLRGNLDTRVRKLGEGQYDTIVVAEAGLKRLGYTDFHPLEPDKFIPAACQGALAITARSGDGDVLETLSALNDEDTKNSCLAERAFLTALEGGCQIPAGIHINTEGGDNAVQIHGFISSVDGKRYLSTKATGTKADLIETANKLAVELLDSGGREIIEEIRGSGD